MPGADGLRRWICTVCIGPARSWFIKRCSKLPNNNERRLLFTIKWTPVTEDKCLVWRGRVYMATPQIDFWIRCTEVPEKRDKSTLKTAFRCSLLIYRQLCRTFSFFILLNHVIAVDIPGHIPQTYAGNSTFRHLSFS